MRKHKTGEDVDLLDRRTKLLRIVVRTVAIAVFATFAVLTVVLLVALGS